MPIVELQCELCPEGKRFSIPAPPDPTGVAMMSEHWRTEHETATEQMARELARTHTVDVLALLGKQVAVRITDEHDPEKIIVTGQLLRIGDHGSFVIRDASDEVHYCWPLLEIKEVE